jgi:hypothetical protein
MNDLKISTFKVISEEFNSLVNNPQLIASIKASAPEYQNFVNAKNGSPEFAFYHAYIKDNPFTTFNGQFLLAKMIDGMRSLMDDRSLQSDPSIPGIKA